MTKRANACPPCDVCGASAPVSLTDRDGTVNVCYTHDLPIGQVRAIIAAAYVNPARDVRVVQASMSTKQSVKLQRLGSKTAGTSD